MKFYQRKLMIIPQVPYDKFKKMLLKHRTIHYFFHNTVCLAKLNYTYYDWNTWCKRHHELCSQRCDKICGKVIEKKK